MGEGKEADKMGKRNKVTTRDVAEYAGVSQSTVSMILSGKKNVSFMPETESKVWEAARKLGYKKPVKKALAMENSLSNTILILAPLLTNSYYTTIIHSIVEQAQSLGYDVLTEVTFRDPERESQILSLPKISRLAGIIILYPIRKISDANAIAKTLPVVMVGEKPDNIRFDSVELDSKKPGFLMADHLLSLGHRQIAFICSPIGKHEISRLRRLEGIRMAYEDKGLDKELVQVFTPTSGELREYAYQSAEYRLGYEMCRKALDSDLP
ncbi:MAG: LacI family DNA-binding transcriptional regulator, partial [Eubacterium sp.]|nr:LacI family DNA-binding transcriptional regulator [Eubacterium sp.]